MEFYTQWMATASPLQLAHKWELAARVKDVCSTADLGLEPEVIKSLARKGITDVYRHQMQAITDLHAGKHVMITTSTSSGKSLCYLVLCLCRALPYPTPPHVRRMPCPTNTPVRTVFFDDFYCSLDTRGGG